MCTLSSRETRRASSGPAAGSKIAEETGTPQLASDQERICGEGPRPNPGRPNP